MSRGFTPTPISEKIGVSSQSERGFIGWIVLAIIALALAHYFFDWSIFDALGSEKGRATIEYIKDVISTAWEFLKTKTIEIYEKVF
jgi:hypothetical protein